MSALGSAMLRSPSIAYEAVTPPVVGSVMTETNGTRASARRASAAEILPICMSDRMPSCMRAPPEVETMIRGLRSASARSAARVIFSPTTEPIEPAMKKNSIAPMTTGMPSSVPDAHDDRIRRADAVLGVAQPVAVLLAVAELQRVRRAQVRVELDVLLVVEEHPQPLGRRQPEVEAALRADLEVARELLVVEDLAAAVALDPEPFRDLALPPLPDLLGRAIFLEPHN